jgi:hypothetical protein
MTRTDIYRPRLAFLLLLSAATILTILGLSVLILDPTAVEGALLLPIGTFLVIGVLLWFLPLIRFVLGGNSVAAKDRQVVREQEPRLDNPTKSRSIPSRTQELLEGFESSAPLLFFGVAAIVISILFWGSYDRIGDRYYPLWVVFLLVGGIATVGGTLAALVPEGEEDGIPESTPDYVVLEREKWVATQTQLRNMKALVARIPSADLVKATLRPEAEIRGREPSLKDIADYTDLTGAKLEALRLALARQVDGKSAAEMGGVPLSEKPVDRSSISPGTRPLATPQASSPSPDPSLLTNAPNPMDRRAAQTIGASYGMQFLSPKDGIGPWESTAFRTAMSTGALRNEGESGRDYALRGALESARLAGKTPDPAILVVALRRTLEQSRLQIGEKKFPEFLRSLESECKRLDERLKVPRNAGEPLDEYLARVNGVYSTLERTAVAAPDQKNTMAGFQWALALFRGFLESSIGPQRTAQLVDSLAEEAASGSVFRSTTEDAGDEMATYARLVRNALSALSPGTIPPEELGRILREFDALVTDLKGSDDASSGSSIPAAIPPKESVARVNQIFEAVIGRATTRPLPRREVPEPQEPVQTPPSVPGASAPSPTSSDGAPRAASPSTAPSTKPAMSQVDWEASAFRAAYATGVIRQQNEPAKEYIQRAQLEHPSGASSPPVSLQMAKAVSASLMEAHRGLSEREMSALSKTLEETSRKWSQDVNVPWNPGEPLIDYAVRVRGVLEALDRTAVDSSPRRGTAGLQWALTLFKGFLEGYLGKTGMESVIHDVESTAALAEGGKSRDGSEEPGDELATYAQLVRNSLRSLPSQGYDASTVNETLAEFDTFVNDIRSGPTRLSAGTSRTPQTGPRPEDIHRMFIKVMTQVPERPKKDRASENPPPKKDDTG